MTCRGALREILVPGACLLVRTPCTREELLGEMVRALHRFSGAFPADPRGSGETELLDRLLERERAASTAVGMGVAFPHCFDPSVERTLLSVAVVPDGVEFASMDGESTRVLFLMVAPLGARAEHNALLGRLARLCRDTRIVAELARIDSPEQVPKTLERNEGLLD